VIIIKNEDPVEMVPEQEDHVVHEVTEADDDPMPS
jgi:hypothetical protein